MKLREETDKKQRNKEGEKRSKTKQRNRKHNEEIKKR